MKSKINVVLLFALLFVLFSQFAMAQSAGSEVKVDELTDAQIREYIKRAESIGYNDAQLEQMAAAQGMLPAEILKLRARVLKLRNTDATTVSNGQEGDARTTVNDSSVGAGKNNPDPEKRVTDAFRPKIFGSELFSSSALTFEPNMRMATPRGYIVGPDDELLIDLSGDNDVSYKLKVSPEGTIRIQYVGSVSVGGLTIEQATAKIRSSMSRTYPSLASGKTALVINLGNIRSIKVTLLGEVQKPGSYTLSSFSTVFNALNASGGPNVNGSFRKIQVIRNNKIISTIDIYDLLLNGIQRGNIRLQDQDVINIPVYENRVEVAGEVKRPALFEVLSNESLSDVIRFAGGFTNFAFTASVKVLQNTSKERKITDVTADKFSAYTPLNGDKYIIEQILDRFENRVEIVGAVFRPGQYELDKGLTLKGLIAKADGLKEDAFMYRGYIIRLNADNTLNLTSFDLSKIMSGAESDILLKREDKVNISSIFDLRDEYKVKIQGEVRITGDFAYAQQMNLEDLIQQAGGFREGATPSKIEISRRIRNADVNSPSARTAEIFVVNVDENLKIQGPQFQLEPFDIVTVRSAEGYVVQRQVKIEGEVKSPGLYTLNNKDERISDVIARAGGLTSSAYAEGASLKRPGAEKVNPTSKNAIDNREENEKKILNLKRVHETGANDSLSVDVEQKLNSSDLVGINLVGILKKPRQKQDLILEEGDVIRIPKMLQTVSVTGEVLNPNGIVYQPGKSLKQYVNGAGGFTANALKKSVYIRYANGSAEAAKKFLFFNNYPRVKPGAEIFVPKKAPREPMSTQGWIAVSTAFASLAAIIVSLLR